MTLPATKRDVMLTASSEAPRSDAGRLMEAIVRLTSDPQFNPEGIERMEALYERLADREAKAAFNVAMSEAQNEMRPIATDASNSQTKSRYASYFALDTALRPIYTKHGFSLSFNTAPTQRENEVRMICYVTHGEYVREYCLDMPADGKGAKGGDVMTRTHATGSATYYGMRYLLRMIFNVAIGGDDDGNAAGRTRPIPPRPATESQFITPAQVQELWNLLDRSPERAKNFRERCLNGGVIDEIAPADFETAKRAILDANAKRARQATGKPTEPFTPQGAPSLAPKPQNAPTVKSGAHKSYTIDDLAPETITHMVDPDTGEVTAPPRPTERPRPPRPLSATEVKAQFAAKDLTKASFPDGSASSASSDLDWMELADTLIDEKPDAATASMKEMYEWLHRLFNLMPDKETAATVHWEHIHADGPSRWLREIPHHANAESLANAWKLQVKQRFE